MRRNRLRTREPCAKIPAVSTTASAAGSEPFGPEPVNGGPAAPERVAPETAVPEQAVPETAVLEQVVPEQAASESTAPAPLGPDLTAPELATDELAPYQTATHALVGLALRSLAGQRGAVTLPQFRLLWVLAESGPSSCSRAAAEVGISASALTRLADRLQAGSYVARTAAGGNRRTVVLELTERGRELVRAVLERRQQEFLRVLGQLGPEERGDVARAVDRFARLLVADAGEGVDAGPGVAERS